uniref:DNA topoisomerase 2 n=1 Tax=Mucochytrium quahogii TaxID=96639 RepID=A0A7S2RU85_9STRA|mmetsp:Transcript_20064/g.43403  ORF Transcript_20064/g.43403 Transcript_20064/m.43403 type:complete len:1454 (+) Transcript_20064:253-4614(+)
MDDSFCMELSDDDFEIENVSATANRKKPAKKAAGKKKATKKKVVVEDSSSGDEDFDSSAAKARRTSMEKSQLSNRYQKKTQLEHIMLRPDTYIGSTEKITQTMWVYEGGRMTQRNVTYVPGMYKIFDEILVNASDNKQRDPSMSYVKVNIDTDTGMISVKNDGKGIPVEIHHEHKVYIPELVFGHLMTGENFEDSQQRVVGGRNGYGAKLANIFSTQFTVETNDSKSGKRYFQKWEDNMNVVGAPKVSKASGKDFTCVSFIPDYERFGMTDGLDTDTVALITKRVYDLAGVTEKSVRVYLNGKALDIRTFEKYIDLYLKADEVKSENDSDEESDDYSDDDFAAKKKKTAKKSTKSKGPVLKVYERVNERWEVCIATSPDGQMQQVSFVNGICTMKGGAHVNYIADQVANSLQTILKKKHKGAPLKPHQIKSQLWIFVNALIVNPAFDSQTKETLTTRHPKFGPSEFLPQLSDKSLKLIEKTKIVENVLYWAKAKDMKELSRKLGGGKKNKVKGVEKLDDANNAGGRNSERCTLILTEGDSAKTLAISGLSIVGRDNYGVFPLRGKLLNVREASHSQILKNEEIQNIMKILGLQAGKQYTDTKSMRYGHLMIMTDQDHDGSHIKGLLMNFLHHFWPSLLEIPGFLRVFITPIVKATKGNASKSFYTLPEYETWKTEVDPIDLKRWKIKYYKGLGTSTAKEAKEYFADLETHQLDMMWEGAEAADAIDMAFSKKRVADRKTWLNGFASGTHIDFNVDSIKYKEFVNKELILFSMADNVRSLPSMMDGLKPSQRKVLFSCFKRKLKSDIKVAQLVGYVSEHSSYHHGEVSLASTIVNMAQTFVGSNNINMLFPSGQFGSRILGGKDAASPRYIFTRLSMLTRHLFHENDDALLNYLVDDGQKIEPDFYIPVIPTLLVNGASGIGTGWSTDIPCYNPRDLVAYLKEKLAGREPEDALVPWYKGFEGTIEPEMHATKGFTGRFKVTGVFERDDEEESIIISELPVGTWTQNYKQFLQDEKLFPEGYIKDIRENHTDTKVHFILKLSPEAYKAMQSDAALKKKFKLETNIGTANMHAFDSNGSIKKYSRPEEIIEEFFQHRLETYVKRKAYIEKILEMEWSKLDNKARFVRMVVDGEIIITKRKKPELLNELVSHGFDQFHQTKDGQQQEEGEEQELDERSELAKLTKGYDYLLSMTLWSLTHEKVEQLFAQRDGKREELEILQAKRPQDLWIEDLDELMVSFGQQEEMDEREEEIERKQRNKSRGRRPVQAKKKKTVAPPKYKIPLIVNPTKPKTKTKSVGFEGILKATETKKEVANQDQKNNDDDDGEIVSLSERLKARMLVSPAPKSQSKKRAKELTPKVSKPSPASRSKKQAEQKKRRLKSAEKAPRKTSEPAPGAEEEVEAPLRTKRASRAATKKPAVYTVDSSSEDEQVDDDSEQEFISGDEQVSEDDWSGDE